MAFKKYGHTSLLGSTQELGAWYGGKVSFTMQLQLKANEKGLPHWQFLLDHPLLGSSSRYTRCYGSSWLIRVKLPLDIFSQSSKLKKLKNLLLRPLILNGQVFRFFFSRSQKDLSTCLMATHEVYNGNIQFPSPSNAPRGSFLTFFLKHNNLQENSYQVTHMFI